MRKLVTALAVSALGVGIAAPSAMAQPTGGPGDPTCQAAFVSTSVQPSAFGPGRRAVATTFFGDYPTAVQDAEQAVQEFCAG